MTRPHFVSRLFTALALSTVAAGTAAPSPLLAAKNEIHYQSIESVHGDTIVVADHSPGGDSRYACNTQSGKCDKLKKNKTLRPRIDGKTNYLASPEGTYGVRENISSRSGKTTFTVYDTSGGSPREVGSFTVSGKVVKKAFSPNEKTFIVITNDSTATSYDIPAKKIRTMLTLQADLPFFNVSYRGTYITAYNYDSKKHRIWNTKTGILTEMSGEPSYVEFSESENAAVYLINNNGFRNLALARGFAGHVGGTTPIISGSFLVEDYLYIGEDLFYLANKASPLAWHMYQYEANGPLDEASYGEYFKRVGGKLAYVKIEGKNSNVYLYDTKERKSARLDAAPASIAATDIAREAISIAGRTAALLTPPASAKKKSGSQKRDLFLWLHGGPQRQTSVGYHPYFSYAVYDELLEKLASAGNYVLKLDYSGSWGYGQDFIDTLDRNVGVVEMKDVKEVIEEFTDDHAVGKIYLIGNSYGGYMSMKGANDFSDLIDGIVSVNGVSDWEELIRRIPSSPFRELFDGVPGAANGTLYANASAISHSDKIPDDLPLAVIYGTEDDMVPTWQSKDYAEFMKAHDKHIVLTALKGEKHVLRKRSTLTKLCKAVTGALSLSGVSCSK